MMSMARFTEAKLPLGREEKANYIIVQFKYLGKIPSDRQSASGCYVKALQRESLTAIIKYKCLYNVLCVG